jgi:GT2 family glycosyltransferase
MMSLADVRRMRSVSNKVTIIAVTFNSSKWIGFMLDSIPSGTPTLIIDNASPDYNDLEKIAATYDVELKRNKKNMGFGAACNIGASLANTDFFLFLNPDCRLEHDTIDLLLHAAERFPNMVAANPIFVDENGNSSFKRKSSLLPRSQWLGRKIPEKDCPVPVLLGAALFVRADSFKAINGFDPDIFLFFEDDDLSLRLLVGNAQLMLINDAVVYHSGGASSDFSILSENIKNWHWGYSWIYARVKHKRPLAKFTPTVITILRFISPLSIISKRRRLKYFKRLLGIIYAMKNVRRAN